MIARLRWLRLVVLWGVLLASVGSPHTHAQEPEQQLQTVIGDVFEIMGATNAPDVQFGWVLTRDGQFVEAGRDRVFHTRLTDPGYYLLDGSAQGPGIDARVRLTVQALPRDERPVWMDLLTGVPPETMVITDPPARSGIVRLRDTGQVATLLRSSEHLHRTISGDLRTTEDGDGNGRGDDDDDIGQTLFALEGNPLHLWRPDAGDAQGVRLWATNADGSTLDQRLTFAFPGSAAIVESGAIEAREEAGGIVRFSFELDPGLLPEDVFSLWNFGDGNQSMLDAPTHAYTADDDYEVSVVVRVLTTGIAVMEGKKTVHISGVGIQGSSATSSTASSAASAPAEPSATPSDGGGILWFIVKALLVIIVIALLGVFAVFGIKRILHRESRLQKALESAEAQLLKGKKPGALPADASPEPPALTLTAPDAAPQETPQKPEAAQPAAETAPPELPTAQEPTAPAIPPVVTTQAPAWLQKGLSMEPPAPAAPIAAQTEDDMLPPWLREEGAGVVEGTKATEATKVTEAAPPTQATLTQEPSQPAPPPPPPPPPPPVPPTPEPLPPPVIAEPVTPVAPPPAPAPTVTAPALPPPPIVEPPAPSPLSTTTATHLPSPSPNPNPLDRERERKRRKRQRYRENLKKRQATTPVPSPVSATSAPNTDDTVKFMIKAEGIEKKNEGATGLGNASQQR